MRIRDRFKPAVTSNALLLAAGLVWFCVGTTLLFRAYEWLTAFSRETALILTVFGVISALIVHHFGFLRIVDKNIERIRPMSDKKCLFSFITWKSYLIILVMILMGTILRHSPIPKQFLTVPYIGMGLALILSSLRYIRVLINEIGKKPKNGKSK